MKCTWLLELCPLPGVGFILRAQDVYFIIFLTKWGLREVVVCVLRTAVFESNLVWRFSCHGILGLEYVYGILQYIFKWSGHFCYPCIWD